MKKTIVFCLAALLLFSLFACSKSKDDNPAGNSGNDGAAGGAVNESPSSLSPNGSGGSGAGSETNNAAADPNRPTTTKDTLVFAALTDPGNLRWDNMLDASFYPSILQVFEFLMRYNPETGTHVSPVSERYELDADGLGATFYLKKGILFHNGQEMTADDVLFSLALTLEGRFGGSLFFVDVANSRALDDYTLNIRFNQPIGPWEGGFQTIFIISKAAYEEMGEDEFWLKPVSPARYKLVEYASGDYIKWEAFDDYYKGEPRIKNLTARIIPDPSVALMELRTGGVDLMYNITPDLVSAIEREQHLALFDVPNEMIDYIGFNCANPALSDIRVRQAIAFALDIDTLIQGSLNGYAMRMTSLLQPGNVGYYSGFEGVNFPYQTNPDKARELLNEAGYGNGLTLRLTAQSTPDNQLMSEQIYSMLAPVGITVDIQLFDFGTFITMLMSGDYDMNLMRCLFGGEAIEFLTNPNIFGSTNFASLSDGSGIRYDELCMQILTQTDVNVRRELYSQLQREFMTDMLFWYPGFVRQTFGASINTLTGWTFDDILPDMLEAYFR